MAVREEKVKLWEGVRFVKQVGFKLGVNRGVMDEQNGKSKEKEAMGKGIKVNKGETGISEVDEKTK